jgi:hypothetical protein
VCWRRFQARWLWLPPYAGNRRNHLRHCLKMTHAEHGISLRWKQMFKRDLEFGSRQTYLSSTSSAIYTPQWLWILLRYTLHTNFDRLFICTDGLFVSAVQLRGNHNRCVARKMKGKETKKTWVLSSHGGEYEDYTDIVQSVDRNKPFRGTYCLHLHGRSVGRTSYFSYLSSYPNISHNNMADERTCEVRERIATLNLGAWHDGW